MRIHGLVVGVDPGGNPWPAAGIEGHANRCRSSQDLPYVLPAGNGLAPGTDGKPGDPATITFARAVAGGPTANEEQLVTLGPGNCFGLGSAVITNSVLNTVNGLGIVPPNGDQATFHPPGELVTPGSLAPGIQITREESGFRIGYSGTHGKRSIDLPTVKNSPANTLRSTTIPQTGSEGYLYVTGVFDSGPGQYTLDAAAGCTGHLGGTATSNDGSQTLTVSAS